MSIVGYFHANERFDDVELGSVAKNIGDHIYRYLPQAALLLVGFWLIHFSLIQLLFMFAYIIIETHFAFFFPCNFGSFNFQLDNKKLQAVSSGKDMTPVMQVNFILFIWFVEFVQILAIFFSACIY